MKEKSLGLRGVPATILATVLAIPGLATAGQLVAGWNLAGNGRNAIIDVPATFGTQSAPVAGISTNVTTVWKWDATNSKWAFFTPSMDLNQLATYSASKGYSVLKSILPGEGYWINAKQAVTIPDPAGQAFNINKWNLTSGWNLVSTGANITPAAFATAISPFTATTVWAWDPVSSGWYFYAPSLDAAGTLDNYITQKGYKTFAPPLADGLGFWVNRAAVTGSPTASLLPVDQAKQMFAELRTTANSWHNPSDSGALDDQVRRMGNDIQRSPVGGLMNTGDRVEFLYKMSELYESAKAYTPGTPTKLSVGPDVKGNGPYLVYADDFPYASIRGSSHSSYCWTDSDTPANVTKITCEHAGPNSFNGSKLKIVEFVLTATTADNYTYTATRYNVPVTFDTYGNNPVLGTPTLAKDSLNNPFPVGTGSFTKYVGNTVTGFSAYGTLFSVNGTLPPAHSVLIGAPPLLDGNYTSTQLLGDGYTHTETDTVTGLSVSGHHTFSNGVSNGSFDWTGAITLSSTSNNGSITGTVTINNQGTRTAPLNGQIHVNPDGYTFVTWAAYDPVFGNIGWTTYGNAPMGPETGAETVTVNMSRTALPAANTYRYAINGSIVMPGLVSPTDVTVLDPTKVTTLSLDNGSYIDLDETNSATTGSKPIAANFVGTAQTTGTRFTGSVLANSFMSDADGRNYAPTSLTASGAITDTSAGGAGTILNGNLTATLSNYGNYHSLQPETLANYAPLAVELKGTLQLPSRPTMGLTLTATGTGPGKGSISGQYTYDNGLTIGISGTHDSNNPAADSLTLSNQDGITVTIPKVGNAPIAKGTQTLGHVSNGVIYYTDGVFESLK